MGAQVDAAADLSSGVGRDNWLVVWSDDNTGTFDVLSVELELNGIARSTVRTMVAD